MVAQEKEWHVPWSQGACCTQKRVVSLASQTFNMLCVGRRCMHRCFGTPDWDCSSPCVTGTASKLGEQT